MPADSLPTTRTASGRRVLRCAPRCRTALWVRVAVAAHREQIVVAIEHCLSNGLVESVNTKIRLLTRIAFGFARPKCLSPWPCSISEDTDRHYPAADTPHISNNGRIS
ncbi:MAG: transposase [Rhodococcus sp. (in: high G+C Gram-positive bacteria)]